jgi:hypothetical protein
VDRNSKTTVVKDANGTEQYDLVPLTSQGETNGN